MRYVPGMLAAASVMLAGCSLSPQGPEQAETGSAQVSVIVGKAGALAKSLDIEFDTLYITLTAPGEAPVHDKIPLDGNAGQTVEATYGGLASLLVTWTLTAVVKDVNGVAIHEGSTSFIVPANGTAGVSLNLDAQYSMLKANFYPIRDSVTRCELVVDAVKQAEQSFGKQSMLNDTVKLGYDYLSAGPAPGVNHAIRMDVYGEMWGFEALLYSGETAMDVVSGEDASYTIVLQWVGPSAPPPGAATMTVVLGAAATVSLNGELEQPYVLILNENFDTYPEGTNPLPSPWQVFWSGNPAGCGVTASQAAGGTKSWISSGDGGWARADGFPVTRKPKMKWQASVMLTDPAVPAMIGFEYKVAPNESRGFAYFWMQGANYEMNRWYQVVSEVDCDANTVKTWVDGSLVSDLAYDDEERENAFTHFTISCSNGSYATGTVLFDGVKLWVKE